MVELSEQGQALIGILQQVRDDLAHRVQQAADTLPEADVESLFWHDSAMGLHPMPGETVVRRPLPGYVITFHIRSVRHRYHASEDGRVKYGGKFEIGY